jgi:hypothetical protein
VGVGTTTPATKLHVTASGSSFVLTEAGAGGASAVYQLKTPDGEQAIYSNSNALIFSRTSSFTESMRIDSAGNVGIGNSNPAYFLEVGSTSTTQIFTQIWRNNGAQNLTAVFAAAGKDSKHLGVDVANNNFYIGRDTSTTDLTINASGNVGIGTSSPEEVLELDRSGNAFIRFDKTNVFQGLVGITQNATQGSSASIVGDAIVRSQNARVLIDTGGGTRAIFNASGMGLGSAVPSSGLGITFPATQSASSDANTLDDYEEGTYTPTQANFTVSGTSTLTGAYTKIGRLVFVSIKFQNTGTIAHSASAYITLPFAPIFGAVPAGTMTMYVNNNSETFTSGKSGTQCVIDTEGEGRFFPGNLTTTSAGQILYFSGFYRVS